MGRMRLGREQEDGGAPGRLCPATPRNLAVLVNALPRRPVLGRHLLTSARAVVSMLFGTTTFTSWSSSAHVSAPSCRVAYATV